MQKTRLPRLEIVSLRSLILHEDVEQHRVERIGRRLRKEGILKNPPIVGRNPRHRKLIVLDGASRVTKASPKVEPLYVVSKPPPGKSSSDMVSFSCTARTRVAVFAGATSKLSVVVAITESLPPYP